MASMAAVGMTVVRDPKDPGTREMPGISRKTQQRPTLNYGGGQTIGYARVSTLDQDLALQLDELRQAGAVQIYEEQRSGKNRDRPELANALKALRKGDTLLVWKMDRLGRSLVDLVQIVNECRARGIDVRSLGDADFDTTTASGSFMFGIFALLAEYETKLIRERTDAGLKAARARGRIGGRPKVLSPKQVRQARALLSDPKVTIREVCERMKVSRTTLYNYVGAVVPVRKSE